MIVELVGPAGAGKTTLAKALKQSSDRIRTISQPSFRKIECIPFFLKNAFLLSPNCFYHWFENRGKRLSPEEKSARALDLMHMTLLNGWHNKLRRQAAKNNRVIILDQGPVYTLAWLQGLDFERFNKIRGSRWWAKTCKQWSNTLDLVVWVDAPDETLARRVQSRGTEHRIKHKSELEAFDLLRRWRYSLEDVLTCLTESGRSTVLRFNSAVEPLNSIKDRTLIELRLNNRE
jgi:deoxyadenosine/deoxycytidine kinase